MLQIKLNVRACMRVHVEGDLQREYGRQEQRKHLKNSRSQGSGTKLCVL